MSSDKVSAQPSPNLRSRAVAIILGLVVLILTVIFACAGGGWFALVVPLGFLAAAVALVLFQIAYQRAIFPAVALLVLGAVRLAKLLRRKE